VATITTNDADEGSFVIALVGNADSDGNGMPDGWEVLHNVTEAAADEDWDGSTNIDEFVAGTDPRNANSKLAFTSIEYLAQGCRLIFDRVGGRTYRVEFRDEIESNQPWQLLGEITGTGSAVMMNDAAATGSDRRFYKLSVSL
jgi:hypothetical protein